MCGYNYIIFFINYLVRLIIVLHTFLFAPFNIEGNMSSSDYISLRRLKNMHQLSCNAIPDCHNRHNGELMLHNPSLNHNLQNNVNYCVVPAKCVNNNGRIISTDLVYCPDEKTCDDNCNTNQKYITRTIKAYKVAPIKSGTVGFLVEKGLPFSPGQSISCSIMENEDNFFNGIVFDYDKDIGFLSIGAIDNVTGDFSKSVVYNINLILFDPEVVKLKQRMDQLYKYLFQVNLNMVPEYNPAKEQLINLDNNVCNIFKYLFNTDVREEDAYEMTENYLSKQIDKIYLYLFNVKLDRNLDFNPTQRKGVLLNNLKNKVYELYLYLFAIYLEQYVTFDPNP